MKQIDSLQKRLDTISLSPNTDDRIVRVLAIELSVKRQQLEQIETYGSDN